VLRALTLDAVAPAQLQRVSGVDFMPVHVTGDGNCLAHAASRVLVGTEAFYFVLRTAMQFELAAHKAFYLQRLQ
jgi:hypothetical protein